MFWCCTSLLWKDVEFKDELLKEDDLDDDTVENMSVLITLHMAIFLYCLRKILKNPQNLLLVIMQFVVDLHCPLSFRVLQSLAR